VHQRYSTNTFPTWELAQPFRYLATTARSTPCAATSTGCARARRCSPVEGVRRRHRARSCPIIDRGSDSAILDNALELLVHTGRSLPHAMMMMIPEAWQNHEYDA
jgi:glutamate synthase (NADPH) large chain